MSMVECTCKNPNCKKRFMARVADRARGWGRYCSKSCKASHQESKTGQYAALLSGNNCLFNEVDDGNDDPYDDDYWNRKAETDNL